jgi:predicted Zn-dependent protease
MLRLGVLLLIACAVAAAQPDKESALGAALADNLRRHSTTVESPLALDYVNRLGARLAAHLGGKPVTFTYAIIADPFGGSSHKPLWFPGGYIFVPAGLCLETANESAFAAMLAHSMVHIDERHGFPNRLPGQAGNPAHVPLIYIGGWSDNAPVPDAIAKVQRENELKADELAVRVTAAATPSASEFEAAQAEIRRMFAPPERKVPSLRRLPSIHETDRN